MRLKASYRKWLRWLVAIFGLLLIIGWAGGFFLRKLPPDQRTEPDPGMKTPENAEVITLKTEQIAPHIDLTGTVESHERINLSSRISAYVDEIFVSAGDTVAKGQLLVDLDDREMNMQLAMAQAELTQAEIEYRRLQELIRAEAATDQQLTGARATFDRARFAVERINVMLTYSKIVSPIDGMVTDRRVEKGDLVNPGECLLSVYDPGRMRFVVDVPVRLAERLRLGQETVVSLDRSGVVTGTVAEIVGEINPDSRTQQVRIHLESTADRLLPGTFGRVFVNDDAREAIMAPESCIYRVGQLEMAQVEKYGRIKRRLVRTGQRIDGRVEVLAGLADGDRILLKPVHY